MTLSIKSIGGIINEVPKVTDLKITNTEQSSVDIEYKVEDVELTICRHYLYLNGSKKEITKSIGYESFDNIFRYKITGLSKGTPYTIQIGASDGHDEGLSQAIHRNTQNISLFGVKVDESNSNPYSCCTYIEDATGVAPATPTTLGGWANKWPFNKIRMVGFKNGSVTNEINPNDKRYYKAGYSVPSDVDVMVEIPKVYWNFTSTYNGYEVRISDFKVDASYDCYAHKVGGREKDNIYVGAYLGNVEWSALRSKSGVSPTTDTNIPNFRTYAQNVGTGYQLLNWYTLTLLQILYLIAYKNLNSQSALGMGLTTVGNKYNTGGTDSKGLIYGDSSGREQMCFLGIEDFWGNVAQWVDGIRLDRNYNILVTPDNQNFSNTGSGFENIGQTSLLNRGYTTKVLHTNKGGFMPISETGSSSTYYSDETYTRPNCFGRFGGSYSYNDGAGAFYLFFYNDDNGARPHLGARLVYM